MTFDELQAWMKSVGQDPVHFRKYSHWPHDFSYSGYSIVERDGRVGVYSANERQDVTVMTMYLSDEPAEFASEEEAFDFLRSDVARHLPGAPPLKGADTEALRDWLERDTPPWVPRN